MHNLSVVILSKNLGNFAQCSAAVRQLDSDARIILVDDGIAPLIDERFNGICAVLGEKPFCFARNANIGIKAAETDDVLLLNDDALLRTPGGFSTLQKAAYDNPEYGVIASTTNCAGNANQYPQRKGLREDPRMVCFVAVLIPRRTIDLIGGLDERFIGYGMDDDDYCLRVRNAGLKIGIHDGCYVDHRCLPSSFRGVAGAGGDFSGNLQLFIEKWGFDNRGKPAKVAR